MDRLRRRMGISISRKSWRGLKLPQSVRNCARMKMPGAIVSCRRNWVGPLEDAPDRCSNRVAQIVGNWGGLEGPPQLYQKMLERSY